MLRVVVIAFKMPKAELLDIFYALINERPFKVLKLLNIIIVKIILRLVFN